jgi:hypothetical protein
MNFDPANTSSYRNMNPKQIPKISREVYNFYVQCNECLTCPVDEEAKKNCTYEECRFHPHDCGKAGGPVIETRTSPKWEFSIFISRAELVFNYHKKIPFIFRTGKFFNVEFNHNNLNPMDDRFENLSPMFGNRHPQYHGRLQSLTRMLELVTNPTKRNLANTKSKLRSMIKREKERTTEQIFDDYLKALIKTIVPG